MVVPLDAGLPGSDASLTSAIGRVAMASAESDRALTYLLVRMSNLSDHAWILFQGQSSEWLLQSIRSLLDLDVRNIAWPVEFHDRTRSVLTTLGVLYNLRNTVIHGVWGEWATYAGVNDSDATWRPRPRPWGQNDTDGEIVYFVHRSRLRKVPPEQLMTASDVERISSDIENAVQEIRELELKLPSLRVT